MSVRIGERGIGAGYPCYVIAEAGVNHGGDIASAHALIDAAADAHVDAVKFQTFEAAALADESAPKAAYQRRTGGSSESQLGMLERLQLGETAFAELKEHALQRGIEFLTSVFDTPSVAVVRRLDLAAIKVPSGELTNHALLGELARAGKPMIVSTGMASLTEVREAVDVIVAASRVPIVLLHCVSAYPADPRDANLRAMGALRDAFHVPVGFSDHTLGLVVPIAAAALGAAVIEKHLTLDRARPGPDDAASATPDELAELVRAIRVVEQALGTGVKEPRSAEQDVADVARKSIIAARDIARGARIEREALTIRRPGTGLAPSRLESIIGRHAAKDIPRGMPVRDDMVE